MKEEQETTVSIEVPDTTSEKPERNEDGTLKPGQPSLNPLGRPKGVRNLSTMLAEALKVRSKRPDGSDGETWEEMLIKRVIEKAVVKGDMKGIEHIWDRIEGKAPQTIKIDNDSLIDPVIKAKSDALIEGLIGKKAE